MRIVSVTAAKQHLYEIAFDDGQSGFVDKTVWEHGGYASGDCLSEEQWLALCERSEEHRARERGLYYLGNRDYGSGELVQKLVRSGIDRELSERVVARFVESGLIDDVRYATMLARDMQSRKLYPKRRISMALHEKGFSNDCIEEALCELPDEDEQQALELLKKKRYNKLTDSAMREKALAMLARYGFSYAVSRRALEHLEQDEC